MSRAHIPDPDPEKREELKAICRENGRPADGAADLGPMFGGNGNHNSIG